MTHVHACCACKVVITQNLKQRLSYQCASLQGACSVRSVHCCSRLPSHPRCNSCSHSSSCFCDVCQRENNPFDLKTSPSCILIHCIASLWPPQKTWTCNHDSKNQQSYLLHSIYSDVSTMVGGALRGPISMAGHPSLQSLSAPNYIYDYRSKLYAYLYSSIFNLLLLSSPVDKDDNDDDDDDDKCSDCCSNAPSDWSICAGRHRWKQEEQNEIIKRYR